MELMYRGKTKDVYRLDDGRCLLKFKDDLTGEGGVFDPGANRVGLKVEGAGRAGLSLSKFFFEKLRDLGIPTHYIEADLANKSMIVQAATMFGNGLELICRYRAVGSFLKRYGMYAKEGQELEGYVEVTLKDDDRNDPLITDEALAILGIMTKDEYRIVTDLTKRIGGLVKEELAKKGLDLYDIKFEFARVGDEGQIALIDEISGGNMRAYKDGRPLDPLTLEKIMLE